jgi:excisionase family DNA binding protein
MGHNRIPLPTRATAGLTERSREIRVDEKTPESQRRFRSHKEPAAPQHKTDASENLTEDMIATSDSFSPADMDSCPLTVRDAAKFLGVSQQTVYLWVERKHSPSSCNGTQHPVSEIGSRFIPRVVPTGDGECLDNENMTELSSVGRKVGSGGFATATAVAFAGESPPRPKTGTKPKSVFAKGFRPEITTSLMSLRKGNP